MLLPRSGRVIVNGIGRGLSILAAIPVVLALVACAAGGPAYVDEGRVYTGETVVEVLEGLDTGEAAGRPTSEAAELREDSLVALRRRGGGAATAADLLTTTFANLSPGVPVYVERAVFEGKDALVVAEVIGRRGGKLDDTRIWVISDSGDILFSGTR